MANTLKCAWIHDYFLNVAETYGGSYTQAPVHTKSKKVQITKFLTFQQSSNDDCVWAIVSDKEYIVPVRFTKDALEEYTANYMQDSQGKRLTQFNGNGVQKMVKEATLTLDVGCVEIIGSAQEPVFGSPEELKANHLLLEWIDGLRKGGGEGNILKLKKEQQNVAADVGEGEQIHPPAVNAQAQMQVRRPFSSETILSEAKVKPSKDTADSKREHAKAFQSFMQSEKYVRKSYGGIVDTVAPTQGDQKPQVLGYSDPGKSTLRGPDLEDPLPNKQRNRRRALSFSSPIPGSPPRKVSDPILEPTTPSSWSETAAADSDREAEGEAGSMHSSPASSRSGSPLPLFSPAPSSHVLSPVKSSERRPNPAPLDVSKLSPPTSNMLTSSLSAPTPAQRRRQLTPSSSYPMRSPSPSDDGAKKVSPLMPDVYFVRPENRRVPPPALVPHPTNAVGRGQVLVPNSDTSGTASQLHTQSQSQSQEQSNSPNDPRAPRRSVGASHTEEAQEIKLVPISREVHRSALAEKGDELLASRQDGVNQPPLDPTNCPEETATQLKELSHIAVKGSQPEPDDLMIHARLKNVMVQAPMSLSLPNSSLPPLPSSPLSLPIASYEAHTSSNEHPIVTTAPLSSSFVEETVALEDSTDMATDNGGIVDVPAMSVARTKRRASSSPDHLVSTKKPKLAYLTAVSGPEHTLPATQNSGEMPPHHSPGGRQLPMAGSRSGPSNSHKLETRAVSAHGGELEVNHAMRRVITRADTQQVPSHPSASNADSLAHHRREEGQPAAASERRKLNGFELNMALVRKEGQAPLMTWRGLAAVLLRTGKMRNGNA